MNESLTQQDHVKDEGFDCKLHYCIPIMMETEKALAKMRASSRGKTYRASVHWND